MCGCVTIPGMSDESAYAPYDEAYRVRWSREDQGWVATCDAYPSLSYVSETGPGTALNGLLDIVLSENLSQAAARRVD